MDRTCEAKCRTHLLWIHVLWTDVQIWLDGVDLPVAVIALFQSGDLPRLWESDSRFWTWNIFKLVKSLVNWQFQAPKAAQGVTAIEALAQYFVEENQYHWYLTIDDRGIFMAFLYLKHVMNFDPWRLPRSQVQGPRFSSSGTLVCLDMTNSHADTAPKPMNIIHIGHTHSHMYVRNVLRYIFLVPIDFLRTLSSADCFIFSHFFPFFPIFPEEKIVMPSGKVCCKALPLTESSFKASTAPRHRVLEDVMATDVFFFQ